MSSEAQQDAFQARLARINSGQTVQCDGLVAAERPQARDVKLTGSLAENAVYPLSIAGAFLLGMFAVMFSRYARFHLLGITNPETDLMLAVWADGGMSFCIGFAIRQILSIEGPEFIAAKAFGITVMVGAMHNLVWLFPGLFALLFSPEWVEFTLELTEFRTVLYMGYLIPF